MNKIDEVKLTAYVLGELSQAESRELERCLEASKELLEEVEEIRRTVAFLEDELAQESNLYLTGTQRAEIERRTPRVKSLWSGLYKYAAAAAAVCFLAVAYVNWPGSSVIEETGSETLVLSTESSTIIQSPEEQMPLSDPQGASDESAEIKAGKVIDRSKEAIQTSQLALKDASAVPKDQPSLTTQVEEVKQVTGLEEESPERHQTLPAASPLAPSKVDRVFFGSVSKKGRLAGVTGGSAGGRIGVPVGPGESNEISLYTNPFSADADMPREEMRRGDGIVAPTAGGEFNTEAYDRIRENPWLRVTERPLSTFSIDVDTASYANVRRFLNARQMPPKDAVRIEELINYFDYDYAEPEGEHPFAVHIETASAPWAEEHLLVRFGLKGEEINLKGRKPGNFVFLIDVSGSMKPSNKLPLLKKALRLMVDNLNSEDRVSLVVYAGASGMVLPSTSCEKKENILQALENLDAGGSTNGGAGVTLAYRTAEENFIEGGINRVILATDGDFNVGVTNQGELTRLIENKAKSGVFLTVLGFGMGNYKDSNLEKLADQGNGNYAYIDTINEARKVLVEEMGGTLVTIAKDVKIQVEFNPESAQAYRLIGYENRLLRDADFNDDTKDAGEIGAGHTVTVLYEVVPPGVEVDLPPSVDPLKYQAKGSPSVGEKSDELLTLKLRYKKPDGDKSILMEVPVRGSSASFESASPDFRFSAAVAGFGMLLRDSAYKNALTFEQVKKIAEQSSDNDSQGYRTDFVSLVKKAAALRVLEELDD